MRTGFEAYGGAYFEGGSRETIQILGINDGDLEEWGRDQAAAVAPIPTDAQPASAVFQAGCPMHCGENSNGLPPRCRLTHARHLPTTTGMQFGLYANVEQDGVTMMDAIVSHSASDGLPK